MQETIAVIIGCWSYIIRLVQVGNGIELEAVSFWFEPYQWRPCGVTWDSSRTVMVVELLQTSALILYNIYDLAYGYNYNPSLPLHKLPHLINTFPPLSLLLRALPSSPGEDNMP